MNQIFLWHKSCFSASQAGFPPCTENRLCGCYIVIKMTYLGDKMKIWKYLLLLSLATIFSSNIFSDDFLSNRFNGTYLSNEYSLLLLQTKSHILSMKEIQKSKIYEVVTITSDKIYSNLSFHDQYALKLDDFLHNANNYDSDIITDRKDNVYNKISNETDYYIQIRKYYTQTLCNNTYEKSSNGNSIEIMDNGNIKLNGIEYRLYLDVMGRDDSIDLIYNSESHEVYGIKINNNYIAIYSVEDIGEITFDINESTMKEKYRFYASKDSAGPIEEDRIILLKSIDTLKNKNDTHSLNIILEFIGNIESSDSNDARLSYFKKEKNILRNSYCELGNYYFNINFSKAELYYKKALTYSLSNKDMISDLSTKMDLRTWIDAGIDNAPCYYIAYNLACLYAQKYQENSSLAEKENAFKWLSLALRLNYPHYKHLYKDKDIEVLRSEYPGIFNKIIEENKK